MTNDSGRQTDDQRDVLSAETETIAEAVPDLLLPRGVRNVIQVALGVGRIVVNGRWQHTSVHGLDAGDQLDGAGRGNQVAEHALAAADRDRVGPLAKDLLDRQ